MACGAAVWRPAVMRLSIFSDGCESGDERMLRLMKPNNYGKRYTQEHQEGLRQKCGRGAGVFS